MASILIKQASLVNEDSIVVADVLIRKGKIEKIAPQIDVLADQEIDAEGQYLFPGCIDDQVHFREPGLTHKGDLYTESRAAVAGGVTSFMEMPNTIPNVFTQQLLEDKYNLASQKSLANYSFFLGASNDNLEEIKKTNPRTTCGIKIFMGSSTGNMLVDNDKSLEEIFRHSPTLIATHCEDEATIRNNTELFKSQYGDALSPDMHPLIRTAEACYLSSSKAVDLAKKTGARLHILHISTAKELDLFRNDIPLKDKKITAEACIHHLWFSDKDYSEKGNFIKWNPAIKTATDRDAIFKAVLDNRIDVIATDHAPHTPEEKSQPYASAPSGGPLVQHSLVAMLDFYHQGKISLEKIAEKMAHHPATLFQIEERGFIREGYWADLVLVKLNQAWTVKKENILAKCGWSPFLGHQFQSTVSHTIVSGKLVYAEGQLFEVGSGQRLVFNR
jgi:dihydroorotase